MKRYEAECTISKKKIEQNQKQIALHDIQKLIFYSTTFYTNEKLKMFTIFFENFDYLQTNWSLIR